VFVAAATACAVVTIFHIPAPDSEITISAEGEVVGVFAVLARDAVVILK
jgi:hypothetical protein